VPGSATMVPPVDLGQDILLRAARDALHTLELIHGALQPHRWMTLAPRLQDLARAVQVQVDAHDAAVDLFRQPQPVSAARSRHTNHPATGPAGRGRGAPVPLPQGGRGAGRLSSFPASGCPAVSPPTSEARPTPSSLGPDEAHPSAPLTYSSALLSPPPPETRPHLPATGLRACQAAHAVTLQSDSFLVTGIPCNISERNFRGVLDAASTAMGISFPHAPYLAHHQEGTWRLLPYQETCRDAKGRLQPIRRCSLLLRAPKEYQCTAGGYASGPCKPLSVLTRAEGVPGLLTVQALPPTSVADLPRLRPVSVIRGIPRDPRGSLAALVRASHIGSSTSAILPLLQCRYVPSAAGSGIYEVLLMDFKVPSTRDPSPAITEIHTLGLPLQKGPTLPALLAAPPLQAWSALLPTLCITGIRGHGSTPEAIQDALRDLQIAPSQVRCYFTDRSRSPHVALLLATPQPLAPPSVHSKLQTILLQDIGGTHVAFRKNCLPAPATPTPVQILSRPKAPVVATSREPSRVSPRAALPTVTAIKPRTSRPPVPSPNTSPPLVRVSRFTGTDDLWPSPDARMDARMTRMEAILEQLAAHLPSAATPAASFSLE